MNCIMSGLALKVAYETVLFLFYHIMGEKTSLFSSFYGAAC